MPATVRSPLRDVKRQQTDLFCYSRMPLCMLESDPFDTYFRLGHCGLPHIHFNGLQIATKYYKHSLSIRLLLRIRIKIITSFLCFPRTHSLMDLNKTYSFIMHNHTGIKKIIVYWTFFKSEQTYLKFMLFT